MPQEPTGAFKCPRCGATSSGNHDNCTECGVSLNVTCSGCGETWRHWRVDYVFCPKCGQRIEQEQTAR